MALERSTATTTATGGDESAVFECNICFDLAQEPVITPCGHLHCWPCIYKWLNFHSHSNECPVCKTLIQEQMLVPLYGRGMSSRFIPLQNGEIPRRPAGPRPETAPPPPRGSQRALGNFERSFSGVLSPVFGVQFREFYGGSSLGFNYGLNDEGEYWNDKKMMKILVFILVFVIFDFIAM